MSAFFFWSGAVMFLTCAPILWLLDIEPTTAASADFYTVCACNMFLGIGLRVMRKGGK